MIHSVFILSELGDVIAEKHWRGLVSRSVCDYFWEEVTKCTNPEEIPPIITTPRFFLFSVTHYCRSTQQQQQQTTFSPQDQTSNPSSTSSATPTNPNSSTNVSNLQNSGKIYFLAVCGAEVNALVPIEFLHRMNDVFEEYFGPEFSEADLAEEFTKVYQLLEEMADNGCPVQTEPAILRQMVSAPGIMGKIGAAMGASSEVNAELPISTLTNVPWRRQGLRYGSNEFFLDIIEEVDAIIDSNGACSHCEVIGSVLANCKLSGMPDFFNSLIIVQFSEFFFELFKNINYIDFIIYSLS